MNAAFYDKNMPFGISTISRTLNTMGNTDPTQKMPSKAICRLGYMVPILYEVSLNILKNICKKDLKLVFTKFCMQNTIRSRPRIESGARKVALRLGFLYPSLKLGFSQ